MKNMKLCLLKKIYDDYYDSFGEDSEDYSLKKQSLSSKTKYTIIDLTGEEPKTKYDIVDLT